MSPVDEGRRASPEVDKLLRGEPIDGFASDPPNAALPIVLIVGDASAIDDLERLASSMPNADAALVIALDVDADERRPLTEAIARSVGESPSDLNDLGSVAARGWYVLAEPPSPSALQTLAAHGVDAFLLVLSGSRPMRMSDLHTVRDGGGTVLVQARGADGAGEAEGVDALSRSVVDAGCADAVLSREAMAKRLAELLASRHHRPVAIDRRPDSLSEDEETEFAGILSLVRARTGHDFTAYRRATVLRRIARRLQMSRCRSLAVYRAYLRDEPTEVQALFDDLLITVTAFFRDADAWDALASEVLPTIFERRDPNETVRVWAAGCATGEEAYSLVMLLIEEAERRERWPEVQVFATDLDESALASARIGRYPASIAENVSPDRLERFFIRDDDHYRVAASLRERVLFTTHNLLRDPPFTRLDLVCCRNLMIYLDRGVQRELLDVFRYALDPDGFLFLGVAETLDSAGFTAVDAGRRLFRKQGGDRPPMPTLIGGARTLAGSFDTLRPAPRRAPGPRPDAELSVLLPPSLLLDERRRVVRVLEGAGRYLELPDGAPSEDPVALVRPELRAMLRVALHRASQRGVPVAGDPVSLRFADGVRRVTVWVRPGGGALGAGDDGGGSDANGSDDEAPASAASTLVVFLEEPADEPEAEHREGEQLEHELREALQLSESELRLSRHDYEEALSMGVAANEELQSVNEEYRATAEELETSKEELQSINEELHSVNGELKRKLEEISRSHDDLENLMSATDVATLFLDRSLRIKRFTPQLAELFNVKSSDIGRPIGDLTHRLEYATLNADARLVLDSLTPQSRELRHVDGRSFSLRLRPYRTAGHLIDGVVLTFVDVSDVRSANELLRANESRYNAMLQSMPDLPFVADPAGRLSWLGPGVTVVLGESPDISAGPRVWTVLVDPDDRERFEATWTHANRTGGAFEMRHRLNRTDGLAPWVISRAQLSEPGEHGESEWVGTVTDIDELTAAERSLRSADQHRNRFLGLLGHELRNPLAAIANGLELLARGGVAAGEDEGGDSGDGTLPALQRQVEHMRRLVDDLLDLTRVSNGKIELQRSRFDLGERIEQSVAAIRPRCAGAGLTLSVERPDRPVWIEADGERLVQVLDNLLDNAIKYSDPGGEIELRVELRDGEVLIAVRDRGIGIETDLLESLFDPFIQGDAGGVGRGGLGLGLALVRTLVELHGGRIEAGSDGLDRGSEFRVFLPHGGQRDPDDERDAANADQPGGGVRRPAAHGAASREAGTALRILVVDDSLDVARPFAALLRADGHEVELAHDGASGLERALAQRPDVAFLDLGMPGMDGLELARHLRREFGPGGPVLIAVTGYGQSEDREATRIAGFDQHLLKPVRMAAVREALSSNPSLGDGPRDRDDAS